jgi:hypothetical protein
MMAVFHTGRPTAGRITTQTPAMLFSCQGPWCLNSYPQNFFWFGDLTLSEVNRVVPRYRSNVSVE